MNKFGISITTKRLLFRRLPEIFSRKIFEKSQIEKKLESSIKTLFILCTLETDDFSVSIHPLQNGFSIGIA